MPRAASDRCALGTLQTPRWTSFIAGPGIREHRDPGTGAPNATQVADLCRSPGVSSRNDYAPHVVRSRSWSVDDACVPDPQGEHHDNPPDTPPPRTRGHPCHWSGRRTHAQHVGAQRVGIPGASRRFADHQGTTDHAKPTIVFVHGAFADSSGWNSVTGRLLADGYPVLAFSNPLRGPQSGRRVPARVPRTVTGRSCSSATPTAVPSSPTGHWQRQRQVSGLRRRLRPDEDESVRTPTTSATATLTSPSTWCSGPSRCAGGDADAYIDPAFFPELFAQDLSRPPPR